MPLRVDLDYGADLVRDAVRLGRAVEQMTDDAPQHDGTTKMVILYCLMEFEPVRFNEMKRYLGVITDKTLSSNLKELEADQLIVRKEYPQIPPKVEYSLSERGKSLMKVLDQLCIWGEENRLVN